MNFKKVLVLILTFGLFVFSGIMVKTHIKPYDIKEVLDKDHPARRAYLSHLNKYNDENDVFVLIESTEDLLKGEKLYNLNSFVSQIFKSIENLVVVHSLIDAEYIVAKKDRFFLKRFYSGSKVEKNELEILKKDPLFSKTYIDEFGKSFLLYTQIQRDLSFFQKRKLLKTLFNAGEYIEKNHSGVKVHLLGTEIARFHFMREMIFSQAGILPVVLGIIIFIVFFLFRNWKVCWLTLYVMGVAYSATVCLILALENTISPFSSFALLFVFIIATADLIHFFSALSNKCKVPFHKAVKDSVKKVYKPCLLSSITTMIGFGALLLSPVPPVQYFGLYCCFGIIVCFLMTFYGLPFLFNAFHWELNLNSPILPSFNVDLFGIIKKYNFVILGLFAFLVAFFGYYTFDIKTGDNLYNKFVASHPLSQAVDQFQKSYQFTGTIDVVLKSDRRNFVNPSYESKVQKIHHEIESLDNVSRVKSLYSYQDYIRKMFPSKSNKNKFLFDKDLELSSVFYLLDDYEIMNSYYPHQYDESRMIVFLKSLDTKDMLETNSQIESVINDSEAKGMFVAGTNGFFKIRAALFEMIFSSFSRSFGFSLIGIFLVFLYLFKSLKWAFLAMIPNILPLIAVTGLLGFFNVIAEYNLVVLICIVIGVAVDDTIHFLYRVYKLKEKGSPLEQAIDSSLHQTGRALIGTTLIFVLTLPAFFLTNILLFTQVAFVLIIALILALVADMVVLPTIMLSLRQHKKLKKRPVRDLEMVT